MATPEAHIVLTTSDVAGRPTLRDLRDWSLREVADALVLDEIAHEQARRTA